MRFFAPLCSIQNYKLRPVIANKMPIVVFAIKMVRLSLLFGGGFLRWLKDYLFAVEHRAVFTAHLINSLA